MRLIDADELLKKQVALSPEGNYGSDLHVVFVGEIQNAPTIESAPVWTPCSEGMPTPEQAVIDRVYQKFLVKFQNLDGKMFVERCAYRCERWWIFDYQCYADETHAVALAWMPYQTEPYNPNKKEE
jgi:hypothetical protein